MKSILLLTVFSAFSMFSRAQVNNCGTDEMKEKLHALQPEMAQREAEQNQLIYNYIINQSEENKLQSVVTVPVVVHVVYQGVTENLSDATVIGAINDLNLRFQNQTPFYDATGNTVDIEFCLASVDPWGNPTNGITHDNAVNPVANASTYAADVALKNINRWNPTTYLNIWTVASIQGGYGGYATYPGTGLATDGIVIKAAEVANGTTALVHEVGHYLNLGHTFAFNCSNGNCLLDGDLVCDTPPDVSSNNVCGLNSCTTEMSDTSGFNPFTGDVIELPNYMDYTSCPLSFTQGQADRMEIAVNQIRTSLLSSNGCGANPGGTVPDASFTYDAPNCIGTGEYTFTSTSTNSQCTQWDFQNDGLIDAVGAVVTHTFTSSGTYTVMIYSSSYGGSDTSSQQISVVAVPYPTYPIQGYTGTTNEPTLNLPYTCPGDVITVTGVPGMSSYLWSNGATTQSISYTVDSISDIYLTVTTPQSQTITNCTPVTIYTNVPPTLSLTQGSDTSDCDDLMVMRLLPIPYWWPSTNTWYRDGGLFYTYNQPVMTLGGIPPGGHSFWVVNNVDPIGCVTESDTLSIYLNDPGELYLNWDGTTLGMSYYCPNIAWFHDGVQLTLQDSSFVLTENGCYYATCFMCGYQRTDTFCITDLSINEINFDEQISIYPNPFSEFMTIEFDHDQHNTSLVLNDISGRAVRRERFSGKSIRLDKGHLSAGTYLLIIESEAGALSTRRVQIE